MKGSTIKSFKALWKKNYTSCIVTLWFPEKFNIWRISCGNGGKKKSNFRETNRCQCIFLYDSLKLSTPSTIVSSWKYLHCACRGPASLHTFASERLILLIWKKMSSLNSGKNLLITTGIHSRSLNNNQYPGKSAFLCGAFLGRFLNLNQPTLGWNNNHTNFRIKMLPKHSFVCQNNSAQQLAEIRRNSELLFRLLSYLPK